jgi:hypothetical protein
MKTVVLFLAGVILTLASVIFLPHQIIYLIGCFAIGSFFGGLFGKLNELNK